MEIPSPGGMDRNEFSPNSLDVSKLYVFGGLLYNDHTAVLYPEVEPFVHKINLREAFPLISQPRWSRLVRHVKNHGDEGLVK
jgi:hypothetical protein